MKTPFRIESHLLLLAAALLVCACTPDRPDYLWTNHKPWKMEAPVSLIQGSRGTIPIGVLEFDDQGQMWRDPKTVRKEFPEGKSQLGEVLEKLKHEAAQHPVALVIFVHGWNNNAKDDGGNLGQFKRSLQAMESVMGASGKKVFGVYVSWRGKYQDIPVGLDYYNREAAAQKIGRVEAAAALQALCTTAKHNRESRIMAIGHSFGGLILLRSIAQPMASQVAELASLPDSGNQHERVLEPMADTIDERVLEPMADTIVVVNPADNAILARQMVAVMRDFKLKYEVNGVRAPLLVSATSSGDWATGWVYSAASSIPRYLLRGVMTQSSGKTSSWAQERATVTSVGYHEDIHSHELSPWPSEWGAPPRELTTPAASSAEAKMILKNLSPALPNHKGLVVWLSDKSDGTGALHPYLFKSKENPANQTPYWIMKIPTLVSSGHTDIWNANFTGFLMAIHNSTYLEHKSPEKSVPGTNLPQPFSAPRGLLQATMPQ